MLTYCASERRIPKSGCVSRQAGPATTDASLPPSFPVPAPCLPAATPTFLSLSFQFSSSAVLLQQQAPFRAVSSLYLFDQRLAPTRQHNHRILPCRPLPSLHELPAEGLQIPSRAIKVSCLAAVTLLRLALSLARPGFLGLGHGFGSGLGSGLGR
ncbi:hypothetical protein BC567DRAFT_225219 [Phyllosticta citribraziliensis]